ncbi:MAG: FeoA family protein [Nostoc sp. EfeVER01]|uniref:FeoA family protein n=1 Tax=unclassified Nostoc TaxID=2593658 RepID=UPI002AD47C7C|nr:MULTISPECIES: FeoA family protein [unclassified Nostoc]MDZ7948091.1 FeoA family protein [Nostoc sp. EfeVER01]MDZ7995072.1 FeoA family protein [Nostoc sp. EspVER01]
MFTSFSVTGCSLELLRIGERGIVIFCKTQDKTILKKLTFMGIVTGTHISLKQDFPSFILKIDNRDFVLDLESVRAIYVRVSDNSTN